MNASRIGKHAWRYLAAAPRTGRVTSVFGDGFNVLFDEEDDPGFVSIQMGVVPLHPWALEIETAGQAQVGESVAAEPDRIRIGDGGPSVRLSIATIDELRIAEYTESEAQHASSRLPLLEQVLHVEPSTPSADPFRVEIDGILFDWRTIGEVRVLPTLIGLGSGSTPSGDDVLVGLLAGWAAFAKMDDSASESSAVLRPILRGMEIPKRTHLASAQMISAAADGAFPEPIRDLIGRIGEGEANDAEIRRLVERTVALGATSGRMMLRGLVRAVLRLPRSARTAARGSSAPPSRERRRLAS